MLTMLRRIRILATLASLLLLLVFALVPIVAIAESPPLFRLDRCLDTPLPDLEHLPGRSCLQRLTPERGPCDAPVNGGPPCPDA